MVCYKNSMSWYLRKRTVVIAFLLLFMVVGWTWLLSTIGAEHIVEYIGVKNGYVVMFTVALLGGLSTFTSVAYFATVLTLASAGLNPVFLALASSAGVSIGDAIFYFIGRYGVREMVTGRIGQVVVRLTQWLEHKSKSLLFGVVYSYAAFTPLPNDVLAVLLGIARQRLVLVLPALVLGNFTLTFLLAKFGSYLPF